MSRNQSLQRQKTLLGILATLIILSTTLSLIMPAYAAEDFLADSYALTNDDYYTTLYDEHPSDATRSATAQVVEIPSNLYPTELIVKLVRVGSPVGIIRGAIWATTALDARPTSNTPVAISTNTYTMEEIALSATAYSFYFNQSFQLNINDFYAFGVYLESVTTGSSSHKIYVRLDLSSPTHVGEQSSHYNTAWSEEVGYDMVFEFWANAAAAEGEEEEGWWEQENFANLASYIVIIVLSLTPAGLLAVVFKLGKWGVLIGLVIGTGISYMIFPALVPLWLVFGVIIGIVGAIIVGGKK